MELLVEIPSKYLMSRIPSIYSVSIKIRESAHLSKRIGCWIRQLIHLKTRTIYWQVWNMSPSQHSWRRAYRPQRATNMPVRGYKVFQKGMIKVAQMQFLESPQQARELTRWAYRCIKHPRSQSIWRRWAEYWTKELHLRICLRFGKRSKMPWQHSYTRWYPCLRTWRSICSSIWMLATT